MQSYVQKIEEYENYLSCSICLKRYENPYALTCLHSFCKNCINDYAKNKEILHCPICRTETKISDVKVDFRLNTLKYIIETSAGCSDMPLNSCCFCNSTIHPKEVQLCKECGDIMCLNCRINHENGRKTNSHEVFSLTSNPVSYCKEHNKKLEYFCNETECKMLLCVSCALVYHEGHEKCTIEKKAKHCSDQILSSLAIASEKVKELQWYVDYSKNCQREVEDEYNRIEALARGIRDSIFKKANELYCVFATDLKKTKLEIIPKIERSITSLLTSEENLKSLAKYSPTFFENMMPGQIIEIQRSVDQILNEESNIDCQLFEVITDNQEFKVEVMVEDSFQENRLPSFDKHKMQIHEVNDVILSDAKSTFYYKKVIKQPRLISQTHVSGITDIAYDIENDAMFYLINVESKTRLVRISEDGSTEEILIDNCYFNYSGNYLAFLPSGEVVILCYVNKVPDRLVAVSKELMTFRHFPLSFCKINSINVMCSSPCKNFIFFKLCQKMYKLFLNDERHEEAACGVRGSSCMTVCENADHIVCGGLEEIELFSFNEECILYRFGESDTCYYGVSFLTGNLLLAVDEDSLSFFNVDKGEFVKKCTSCIFESDEKEFKILEPTLCTKRSDFAVYVATEEENLLEISF